MGCKWNLLISLSILISVIPDNVWLAETTEEHEYMTLSTLLQNLESGSYREARMADGMKSKKFTKVHTLRIYSKNSTHSGNAWFIWSNLT